MKLKKGDKVKIMTGKDRGREGTIDRVWPDLGKVAIAGVNVYKRHTKPRGEGQKGGIVDFVRPLVAANVALICPKCKQVTRVGYRDKTRICKKCEQNL